MKQAKCRRNKGNVALSESYVIAINGDAVSLANYGFGVSVLPYVVESPSASDL